MSLFIEVIAIVRFDVQHSSFTVNNIQKQCCLAKSYFCLLLLSFYSTGALN